MSDNSFFAHPTAVIDDGCTIGENSRVWHFCHIMTGATIGNNCNLGQNVMVASGVSIGNNVKIQNNVSVYEGVTLEDNVFVGPSAVFTNVLNPRCEVNRRGNYLKTTVRQGATIGANATIKCGIEIGQYAFVGAGSVVTRDVKPFALVVGNPARQTGWMSRYGTKLSFNEHGLATCPGENITYRKSDNVVSIVE